MDLKVLWTISNSMGTASDLKMLKESRGFNIDIVTADTVNSDSIGFAITGKRYIVPSGSNPGYISKVMDICEKEKVTTIIPQYGEELVPLSSNLKLFEDMDIKVLISEDTKKLDISNNKKKLYDFFKGNRFLPLYEYASTLDSLEKALYKLGYPFVPVCIKPVCSEGSKGFRIVTGEKVDIFNEKPDAVKISWKVLKQQLKDIQGIPELVVMEYLPGTEYSVDCVCKNGETYLCIPRQRVETSMGVATVSVIEKNDDVIKISREIISKLKLSYNINIQFKYSLANEPKLIEVNPRVSGSLVANYGAGVNMLEASLKLAYGIPIDNIEVNWDTKMIRYWDQIFIRE